jgi:protein-disulfide isomerase
MYTNQPEENSLSPADNLAFLQKTTSSITGISEGDVAKAAITNQAAYDTAINADKTQGQSMGISATPSFIIGTQLIAGAYPYATFQAAINPLVNQ